MSWARLDDRFFMHPKVIKAGHGPAWLWIASIGYASANLTDGFIPESALVLIGNISKTIAKRFSLTLVDVGLFEKAEGGFMIHDYLEWNPSAADVRAKRQDIVDRVQKHRDKKKASKEGDGNEDVTRYNRVSNAIVTPPPSHPIPSHPDPERNSETGGGLPDPERALAPEAPTRTPDPSVPDQSRPEIPAGYRDSVLDALRAGGKEVVELQSPPFVELRFVRLCLASQYVAQDLRTLGEFLASGKSWSKRKRFDLSFLSLKDGEILLGLMTDARSWSASRRPATPPEPPTPSGWRPGTLTVEAQAAQREMLRTAMENARKAATCENEVKRASGS